MPPTNGHPRRRPTPRPDPARLREAVDLAVWGLFGGGWDPRDFRGADYGFGWPDVPNVPPYYQQSQKRGEVLPVYRTEWELRVIRDRSRRLCAENEFAVAAVENRRNYVVSTGIPLHAVPDSPAPTDDDVRACRLAQVVLDAFQTANRLPLRQSDCMLRLDRDGEALVRCFPRGDGLLLLRMVEPEHLRSPTGDTVNARDTFGVRTDPEDVESVRGFWVVTDPVLRPTPVLVDAADVLHLKLNTDLAAKRGLPTFYPVEPNLKRVEDLLASMTSMAKARAKIAWVEKLKGSLASAADSLVASMTDVTATDPAAQRTRNLEQYGYGSIVRTDDGREYDFPNASVDAAAFVEVLQAELRSIAARLQMPEWMLSADASNANLASSLVAEAPSTRAFARLQKLFTDAFGEAHDSLAWRQLRHAVACRVLPADVLWRVKVQADAPSLVVRDREQEAGVNQIYFKLRVKDRKTIQQEQGLDPAQVDRNFRADGIDPTRPEPEKPNPIAREDGGPASGAGLRRLASESSAQYVARLKERYGEAEAERLVALAETLWEAAGR